MQNNNYLSLILGTLPENIINDINDNKEFQTSLFNNDKLQLYVQKIKADLSTSEIIVPKQQDEENIAHIADFLNKDLSSQKSNIALKNAVSGLVADENTSQNFAPRKLNISEHLSEKANDVGTLYHSVLEKINFKDMNNSQDVQDFCECNFSDTELKVLNEIGYENIYNNINILKQYITPTDRVLKEQRFVMCVNYNEVVDSSITDKVLIQGIIDLAIIKPDKIVLIDYKHSNKSPADIKNTYQKQISLYELALKKQFKNTPITKLILSLKTNQIIEM